jgi:UDP-N-acetylmuramate--L-alanine ligase
MTLRTDPGDDARTVEFARSALARPLSPFPELPPRLVVVDADRQRLTLLEAGRAVASWPVSTAAAGVGGAAGSLRTPPGWHRIQARIGHNAAPGAVFESREPTGEVWRGEKRAEDLILTRILTLEGLEEGVNRGPGCDSLERFIYIHGTNHEDALGRPASHGCVRMSNPAVVELFERVRVGDPVVVVGGSGSVLPDPFRGGRFHYAGLGGSGMSALAQFQAMKRGRASGSDRSFDRGERPAARAQLERLGIAIYPQDGSGLGDANPPAALVVSTAVEEQVPDFAAARAREIPIVHRSELLARFVASHRTIAVAGTSGKSTVVAMIFEILRGAGRDPSVITGGDLVALQREGLWGNAWAGHSDLLVVEADESDGSLVRYEPAVGVILNLQRDHRELEEVGAMFDTFAARTREAVVVGESLAARFPRAVAFGAGPAAAVRAERIELERDGSRFEVEGVRFTLPVPGRHNVDNAVAAIAACRTVGVAVAAMARPLASFQGVGRRFQSLGRPGGIEVIDDFAHNPAKIEAAIATARPRARRVLAVYQPHGYGPTRFLRDDFVRSFSGALAPDDWLWMLEIFYAGGTAQRDFSAADIVAEIAARGRHAEFAPSREWLVERIAAEAREGDLVLVMGARDPSLTDLARRMVAALGQRHGERAPARPADRA